MARISQTTFGGLFPKLSARLIPENGATIAKNVSLDNGRLAPMRGGLAVNDHNGAAFNVPSATKTIYCHRNRDGSTSWIVSPKVLHFSGSPVREDSWDRLYWTGDVYPRFALGTAVAASTAPAYQPSASLALGIPAPISAPLAIVTTPTEAANATSLARAYVFTYVSGLGEEGPPSPASLILDAKQGDVVTLTFTDAMPSSVYSDGSRPARRRIYRTNSSGSFQFVGDTNIAAPSFADALLDEAMGELLPTSEYAPPPDGDAGAHPDGQMLGLTAMPNGVLAGFSGRTLFFSEPYLPHSFPPIYSLTTAHRIVGLVSVSIGLVVLTTGKPALATGSTPGSMALVEIDNDQACLSARTIVDMGDVAIFAGPDGLVSAGENGFENLTRNLFSKEQWQTLNPATMHACKHDGRYLFFYDTGSVKAGYMVDFTTQTPQLVALDFYARAGFHDAVDGRLYLVMDGAGASLPVQAFDEGAILTYDWQSRELRIETPINPGCALIDAESYDGFTSGGAQCLKFELYGDGALIHTEMVTGDEMFRLPDGYRAREFRIRVQGKGEINAIHIAENPQELSR